MRTLVAVAAVLSLGSASFGGVQLWINTSSSSIPVGGTATISLEAGATDAGVASVGGYIVPSRNDVLANNNLWFDSADFQGGIPNVGSGAYLVSNGNCGVNAYQGSQTTNPFLGYLPLTVTVLTYTVTGVAPGSVTLTWQENSRAPGPVPTVDTQSAGLERVYSTTITVTPEPATLALLSLGGLLIARRRQEE